MKNKHVGSPEILPVRATASPDDHGMISGASTHGSDELATSLSNNQVSGFSRRDAIKGFAKAAYETVELERC